MTSVRGTRYDVCDSGRYFDVRLRNSRSIYSDTNQSQKLILRDECTPISIRLSLTLQLKLISSGNFQPSNIVEYHWTSFFRGGGGKCRLPGRDLGRFERSWRLLLRGVCISSIADCVASLSTQRRCPRTSLLNPTIESLHPKASIDRKGFYPRRKRQAKRSNHEQQPHVNKSLLT